MKQSVGCTALGHWGYSWDLYEGAVVLYAKQVSIFWGMSGSGFSGFFY